MNKWGKGRGGRPWRRLVDQVKARDKYICQSCGRLTEDGDCDHAIPTSKGGKTELANLQWLCREPCHRLKTEKEAAESQGHKLKARIDANGWPTGAGGSKLL